MDFTNHRLNVNVNNNNTSNVNVSNVRATASKLAQTLNDPDSFKFYCKVARSLPESEIWNNVEQAQSKARNPAAYFTTLCKLTMAD